jgi:hypothetical protein
VRIASLKQDADFKTLGTRYVSLFLHADTLARVS